MKKVLIVDTDMDFLYTLEYLLKKNGYVPIISTDYEKVFETIHEERPEVIILDPLKGPFRSKKFCQRLKADPVLKNTSIIVFSNSTNIDNVLNTYHAKSCIVKPFKGRELLNILDDCNQHSQTNHRNIFPNEDL